MSCVKELLGGLCGEVESRARPWLMFIKGYLPQNWIFKTELEKLTFTVTKEGKASVTDGESSEPDVIIEWTQSLLCTALKTRDKKAIPSGEKPKITIITKKGDAAFGFLRQTFGLSKK